MISVLLPTVRPSYFRRSFDSVKPAAGRLSYEIVVVADFGSEALSCNDPRSHLHCTWLRRERCGPIAAVQQAYEASQGEFVFVMNDESALDPGALEALHDEAVKQPRALYSPRQVPGYTFVYFGRPFAAFPFLHRDLIASLNGLFDPSYKAFYADPDLGMRAHEAGVPVRVVEQAVIRHDNGQDEAKSWNLSRYMAADQATFRARWSHLGEFCDC